MSSTSAACTRSGCASSHGHLHYEHGRANKLLASASSLSLSIPPSLPTLPPSQALPTHAGHISLPVSLLLHWRQTPYYCLSNEPGRGRLKDADKEANQQTSAKLTSTRVDVLTLSTFLFRRRSEIRPFGCFLQHLLALLKELQVHLLALLKLQLNLLRILACYVLHVSM